MEMLSGAEMVVRSLIDQGVKHIFGYPGGAVLDIYDALHTVGGIEHILVRHEQGAVHMADGYARSTGKVGVVLITSGPGATNAITGIATAYMDSIPMVVLSGQVASSLIGNDAFQECDMVGISRPIVKHSFLVKKAEDIPKVLKKAFYLASSGRPGPVVIDLPKDTVNPAVKHSYIYPEQISLRSYNPTVQGHKGQIKRALRKLLNAKKPIIYVGGGAINADCSAELLVLAEKFNIPVVSSLMGLGSFPATHQQSLGMLGMHGTFEANKAMHNSDVIFAVGVRFDDRTTNNLAKYCPEATVLHIDIDPTSKPMGDEGRLDMAALLANYKAQQKVERGFRFLKSPEFLTSAIFLKKPERIEALLMVMTCCLMVYAALEHKIRHELKQSVPFFPDMKNKPTQSPTARWVFLAFEGISTFEFQEHKMVTGMQSYHHELLSLLGVQYKAVYS
ncbi:IS1634 family transposase [Photorhabdus temperata]|uniref:Thiamine pyrophosphate-dependent enzyme, probable carboxylase n=1 Tax=Photorhabdus temperata subsp. temperata Meg1 TaxID=1393735 RepID=A0A081RWZ6_PHOTE|nr:thiamine pyrophosphate-dependent enzyme, probable carboxylase [Photorhabdus temperata subsp. temperata Meg1]